jgi:phenylacetate-CoA ligase
VFTSLTKEALPMIRYRTRDLTRLLPPTARSMRRMEKITGRSDDMLIIRGVNVFPTQIEELILKEPELVAALPDRDHAAEDSRRDGGAGRALAAVGIGGGRQGRAPARAHGEVDDRRVGRRAVVPPGGVERSMGKAKRVVDKRPK